MDKTKKLLLFSIFGALVLVVGVFLIVTMSSDSSDVKYTSLSAGDPVIAVWSSDQGTDKGESAKLAFKNDGTVSGQVSGYGFTGTFKKSQSDKYVIFNKKGKKTYRATIDGSVMHMESTKATLSLSWTLKAN